MSATERTAVAAQPSAETVAVTAGTDAMEMLANEVARGRCILFVGAGVHYPPPSGSPFEESYPKECRPPLGKALAQLLADDSRLAETYPNELANIRNLSRIATFYEMQRSRNQLIEAVQNPEYRNEACYRLTPLGVRVLERGQYAKLPPTRPRLGTLARVLGRFNDLRRFASERAEAL